jgi:hypothetical protein
MSTYSRKSRIAGSLPSSGRELTARIVRAPGGPQVGGHAGEVTMPRGVKEGSKRDRQYEHIKSSYKKKGVSNKEAEERAGRTVNKQKSKK